MARKVRYVSRNTVIVLGLHPSPLPDAYYTSTIQYRRTCLALDNDRNLLVCRTLPVHTPKFTYESDRSHVHVPVADSQAAMPMPMSTMMLYV